MSLFCCNLKIAYNKPKANNTTDDNSIWFRPTCKVNYRTSDKKLFIGTVP